MQITYLSQSVDTVTGIGRVVWALANQMSRREHEVHCVSQSCEHPSLSWHKVVRSHVSNGLDKFLYRVHEPLVSRGLHCDIRHSMGVGKSAHVVSAGSCHKVGIELARVGGGSRLRSRNWGVYDRLSLEDERRLMMADSSRVIVAVSRLVREQLLRCYPIDPSKIVVIPNGVDTSLYASMRDQAIREGWRVAMGIRPEDSVLLFVGNEFDRKGVQTIIEALPLLQDLPVVVLVAGDDETSPYRSLAERLNVASKVRFLGRFDRVERLFGIADLFVFPTKYEPFGLVIIEAMAAGVPVITSRHAGAVEDLLDGEHGLFIDDPLSAQELAASIRRLMVNPQLQSRLAETCRTMVKKFDWTKIGDSFEELYRRIASEAPPTDAL